MKQLRKKSREAAVLTALTMCLGLIIAFMESFTRQQYTELEWEDLKIEEIQTVVQEAEQTEDISINGIIQECQKGTITKEPQKVIEFTFEESQELMKMAQAEAGNQGTDGMWLVMSVAVNRMNSEDYPDNITDVINQKLKNKKGQSIYQFSSVADGRIEEQTILQAEVHEALARIESGDVAEKIIAFEVMDSTALDKYFQYAFTYRKHRFYTKKIKQLCRGKLLYSK